jgi:hypothetical protein
MENLKNIVGLINFIVILDNNGRRIYSKYFLSSSHYLFDIQAQKEFEKKMGQTVMNLNVSKNNDSN